MKLKVRQLYPCTPDQYWEMYWDDDFDARLQEGSKVDRAVLSQAEENGVLTRRLRFTPHAELPGPVAAIVGSPKLVWEQINRWNKATGVLSFEVLPTFISADKFNARGTFAVKPDPGGCVVEIDGDIDVKVRFIGGRIEAQVVSQIEDGYAHQKRVSDAWLAEKRANS